MISSTETHIFQCFLVIVASPFCLDPLNVININLAITCKQNIIVRRFSQLCIVSVLQLSLNFVIAVMKLLVIISFNWCIIIIFSCLLYLNKNKFLRIKLIGIL